MDTIKRGVYPGNENNPLRRFSTSLNILSAVIAIVLCIPLEIFAGTPAFPSHCTSTETVVFSCKVRSSQKYISLCGAQSLRASDAYLVYRFGPLGQKEFSYPRDLAGSIQKFRATHYFRARVDRRAVSFTNAMVTYEIFSNFEGEESRPHRDAGVTITMIGEKMGGKTLQCSTPYFDRLEKLDGVVSKGRDYLDDDE
ncbi:hypothetical protein KP004_12770 [Geomonas oryzisoli]|uniref:Uncharacterized protein n=1 Tax=Geomonas oryzisoli TaxID=2847992 RepID=A0ABX8J1E7_9BACT|nr:hypothetical protein [Geomonas oryzisoli]QWV92093.1 hypothetical protein KP004_12770 [Geomonas oryzisoli]